MFGWYRKKWHNFNVLLPPPVGKWTYPILVKTSVNNKSRALPEGHTPAPSCLSADWLPLDLRVPGPRQPVHGEAKEPCLQVLAKSFALLREGRSVSGVNWVRSESLASDELPSLRKSWDFRSSQTAWEGVEIGSQWESRDKKVAAPGVRGLFPGRNWSAVAEGRLNGDTSHCLCEVGVCAGVWSPALEPACSW